MTKLEEKFKLKTVCRLIVSMLSTLSMMKNSKIKSVKVINKQF